MYSGTVIRNETIDPEYKVKFTYSNESVMLKDCFATFLRLSPTPKVVFDDYTDYLLERLEVDDETIKNIRLEIGKTVCDFIFSSLDRRR